MTISLKDAAQAVQLRGLKWLCSECLAAGREVVNRPTEIDCRECGKQRWVQFGLEPPEARELAKRIHKRGYDA